MRPRPRPCFGEGTAQMGQPFVCFDAVAGPLYRASLHFVR